MTTRNIKTKNQKMKKNLKKIAYRERDRLGSSGVVNTKHFLQRQKFGPASSVRHISPEEYLNEEMTSKPINPISFHVMKKQVRKKKVSTKSTKERIADKTVSLAERLEYQTHK